MRLRAIVCGLVIATLGGCGDPPARATPTPPPSSPAPVRDLGTSLDAEELRRRLAEIGLGRVAPALVRAMRPCARLVPRDGTPPFGPTTRLGGAPDLPPDVAWPQWNGRSLAFLLQLRLEELPSALSVDLPSAGLLSFFYTAEQTWGIDAKDRGSFQVLFHSDASVCVRRDAPDDVEDHVRFLEVPVLAALRTSLPSPEHKISRRLRLSDTECEALETYADSLGGLHQVGGYTQPVQSDDMEADCEAMIRRIRAADATGQPWLLLLQVGSDDAPGWMWGDVGRLYFWIREDDLARRDFSRIWMQLQCY